MSRKRAAGEKEKTSIATSSVWTNWSAVKKRRGSRRATKEKEKRERKKERGGSLVG